MKAKDSCTDSPLDPKDDISITWHEQPSHSVIIPFTDLAVLAYIFRERNQLCLETVTLSVLLVPCGTRSLI